MFSLVIMTEPYASHDASEIELWCVLPNQNVHTQSVVYAAKSKRAHTICGVCCQTKIEVQAVANIQAVHS